MSTFCVRPRECGLKGRSVMTILKRLATVAAMIVIASSVAVAQNAGAPIGKTPSPHKHKHYKMHMRTTPHTHKHMKTQG
jgi:hypothetical protein